MVRSARSPVDARVGHEGTRIDLDGLTKRYRVGDVDVTALDGIDLHVDDAAFVAILGPSGCGKTTLLNMIGALDTPTSGSVRVAGDRCQRRLAADRSMLRRHRSASSSRASTCSRASPRSRTCGSAPTRRARTDPAERALRRCAQVGLAERHRHFPHQLSGGEQQRVAIARALATGNPILLADEPTGELDFRTGVQILGVLEEQARRGMTVLVVTHNREIARVADRVVELSSGRIVVRRSAPRRQGRHRRAAMVTTRSGTDPLVGVVAAWSWRDFRAHWVAIVTIALVLAIGTGVYAGLGSTRMATAVQRRQLRGSWRCTTCAVTLSPGTFVEHGRAPRARSGRSTTPIGERRRPNDSSSTVRSTRDARRGRFGVGHRPGWSG